MTTDIKELRRRLDAIVQADHHPYDVQLAIEALGFVEQLSAQTAEPAGLFEKRSMFGPWIEVERPTDKSVPLYTHPAKTEQPVTLKEILAPMSPEAGALFEEVLSTARQEQPSLSDERELFEAHIRSTAESAPPNNTWFLERSKAVPDMYYNQRYDDMWKGWQAAISAQRQDSDKEHN